MSNFTNFFIRAFVEGVVVRVEAGFVLGVYEEVWDGWWLNGWMDWGYETFCVDFDVDLFDLDVDCTFGVDVAFSVDCYTYLLDVSIAFVVTSSLISYCSYLIRSPTNFPFSVYTLFPFFLLNPLLK